MAITKKLKKEALMTAKKIIKDPVVDTLMIPGKDFFVVTKKQDIKNGILLDVFRCGGEDFSLFHQIKVDV